MDPPRFLPEGNDETRSFDFEKSTPPPQIVTSARLASAG
jgi:hypothetical protein